MYLKRLEIKGFKSFADITEINLKPGINVVVGPNGCGKSNIVDAIRWVLGETNVRHIRGQKNEDIIFNGTDKKKSQGMAYAEIIIDNYDHVLPLDFNEITVERKSFRSGESEFYLNKTRVRMRDIVELFTGTGLGKKGYSIINQGELEQVLNSQPLERRLILEEASGIIRHRQKRDEVKKRLTETSNDILRLGDLLDELGSRKESIGEKAEKAAEYMEAARQHDELEKDALFYEWRKIDRDTREKSGNLGLKQEQLDKIQTQIAIYEKEIQLNEAAIQENYSLLAGLKEEKYQKESVLNSIESEIKLGQEKINNARERIIAAQGDSEKYLSMLENLKRDIGETLLAFSQDEQQFTQRQREYQQMEKEINLLQEETLKLKTEFEDKKAEVFAAVKQETEIGNMIISNEGELKRAGERKERMSIHLEDVNTKIAANRKLLEDLNKQVKDCEEHNTCVKSRLTELKGKKDELGKFTRELLQENDELKNQMQTTKSKLGVHQEMQKNLAGYSAGVKAIAQKLSADSSKITGYIGIIGELIDVDPGLETAVETALNRGMENIVVKNIEDAQKAINILKEQRMGRVTFLPLDALKVQPLARTVLEGLNKTEGVLGLGSDLVSYDMRLKKAIDYLLGRVLVVRDMDVAIKIYKNMGFPGRIVTLEGELINTSGAITGGTRAAAQMGVIQRKGEEKRLMQALETFDDRFRNVQAELEAYQRQLEDLEKLINRENNQLMEQSFKLQMVNKQKQEADKEDIILKQQHVSYIQELKQIEDNSAEITKINTRLRERKNTLQQGNNTLSGKLERIKQKIETDTRDLEVKKERLNSYQEQLVMRSRELENNRRNIAQFKQVEESYQESFKAANELQERMQDTIIKENSFYERNMSMIKETQTELTMLTARICAAMEKSREMQELTLQHNQRITPLRQNMTEILGSSRNLELAIARLETEQENLRRNWQEKYPGDVPHLESGHEPSSADIRKSTRIIAELKARMESLWPVDLQSVDEYGEISARYTYQKQQYEDLVQARDSLQELLQETEKIMVKDFSHFLLLANESFKKTFKEMFGGGEALLRLNPQDVTLDAGVEIEVKMPGKKMQSLELLSGGERALTSIALIFALLGLRPAPFCLLDEIDASLDETNLTRFVKFLQSMADNMQFIIITHRQTTIACGENIYGVTMPEKGVSSILTLNIQEAENLAG